MEDLLFEEFPPTPPASGDQVRKAIVLKVDWEYDDNAHYVPAALRNKVPDHLKKDGKIILEKGTEGFLYEISPSKQWGSVMFIVHGTRIHVAVKLKYITIGADFSPLSLKNAKSLELFQTEPLPNSNYRTYNSNLMDSFIHAIWCTLRSRIIELHRLGISTVLLNKYFGEDFQQNINTIIQGFTPAARTVLQNGDFSVNNLLTIAEVTEDWPPAGPIIYIRLYDNEVPGTPRSAVYVGQTINAINRLREHNCTTNTSNGLHYRHARRFAPEHRRMLPLCSWDQDIPRHVLNMAEQTVVLMFGSYSPMSLPTNSLMSGRLGSYYPFISFMRSLRHDLTQRLPWAPSINLLGLNVATPLAESKKLRLILCTPRIQLTGSIRTFTRYRTPVSLNTHKDRQQASSITLNLRHSGPDYMYIGLSIPWEDINSKNIPSSGFLVYEIMDDGQPHPSPWIRSPAVGPYEDFIRASTLGMRYEWHDKVQNVWLSISIHKPGCTAMLIRALKANNVEISLAMWRQPLHIIQALKGITYTDYRPNEGFYKQLNFGLIKVIQVQTDHLKQTYQLVERPEILQSFPKKATWSYN
ncbi:hypothetical protein M431DRAFT_102337, partial [Trichoderma harzianum CBS 226.95]